MEANGLIRNDVMKGVSRTAKDWFMARLPDDAPTDAEMLHRLVETAIASPKVAAQINWVEVGKHPDLNFADQLLIEVHLSKGATSAAGCFH